MGHIATQGNTLILGPRHFVSGVQLSQANCPEPNGMGTNCPGPISEDFLSGGFLVGLRRERGQQNGIGSSGGVRCGAPYTANKRSVRGKRNWNEKNDEETRLQIVSTCSQQPRVRRAYKKEKP